VIIPDSVFVAVTQELSNVDVTLWARESLNSQQSNLRLFGSRLGSLSKLSSSPAL